MDSVGVCRKEIGCHESDGEGGHEAYWDVTTNGDATHIDGLYEGTHAQDEQNVHRVAPNYVTDSQSRTAFDTREHVDDHLRQRGTKGHNGQADDKRRHLSADAHTCSSVNKPVGA